MQYERSMYVSEGQDWKNIKPLETYHEWNLTELNDIFYPEKDESFFYTGYQRSGKARTLSKQWERYGTKDKFLKAVREVLNTQPYNVDFEPTPKRKQVNIVIDEPQNEDQSSTVISSKPVPRFNPLRSKSQMSLMKVSTKKEMSPVYNDDTVQSSSILATAPTADSLLDLKEVNQPMQSPLSMKNKEFLQVNYGITSSQARTRSNSSCAEQSNSDCISKKSNQTSSQFYQTKYEVFKHFNQQVIERPASQNQKSVLILKRKGIKNKMRNQFLKTSSKFPANLKIPSDYSEQSTLPSVNNSQRSSSSSLFRMNRDMKQQNWFTIKKL